VFAFLVYGAYLAISWAGDRHASLQSHPERRQRTRRRNADRRKQPRQEVYGVPM